MLIVINHANFLTIDGPVTYILVVVHIKFRVSYHDFHFICIKFQMVSSSGKVADDMKSTLNATN